MRERAGSGRVDLVEAHEALARLGGVATRGELLSLTTRHAIVVALDAGLVARLAHGRYGLAAAGWQRRRAAELSAVLSHLSAAQHHGWAVKHPPEQAWVTVPRNRKVSRASQATAVLTYADLGDGEVMDGVTAPGRTVLDCARKLPFGEALAVADSALREGAVSPDELRCGAAELRGPRSTAARRVAVYADGRAANPFESVLRAIVLDSGVLDVVPQVPVTTRTMTFRPDLVDVRRRVVIEADSWAWHRDQRTHGRDCVRHSALAVAGWLVLRFTWEQVMHSPAYVRAVVEEAAALRQAAA
jgi:very-short-patch-repair endonuclease